VFNINYCLASEGSAVAMVADMPDLDGANSLTLNQCESRDMQRGLKEHDSV